jgi:hypothetical protein
MITLFEFLAGRGFNPNTRRTKLVRHTENAEALRRAGWIETYQQYQSNPVFDHCDQIVVFIGEARTSARFIGVYDVGTRMPASKNPVPPEYPDQALSGDEFFYRLTKRAEFDDLEDRVVIEWGRGALQWAQRFTDREVLEVRRLGRHLPPFGDYLEVLLTYNDLVDLTKRPESHRDWVAALSAVGGIYLIVDSRTGAQYVGSATGTGGIWGAGATMQERVTEVTTVYGLYATPMTSLRTHFGTRSSIRFHARSRARRRYIGKASLRTNWARARPALMQIRPCHDTRCATTYVII